MENTYSGKGGNEAGYLPFFYKNSCEHNILQFLLILSVSVLIISYIVFTDVNIPQNEGYEIIKSITLSYISGYIFYYLTILKQRDNWDRFVLACFSPIFYYFKMIKLDIDYNNGEKIDFYLLNKYCKIIERGLYLMEPRVINSYNFSGIIIFLQDQMVMFNKLIQNHDGLVVPKIYPISDTISRMILNLKDGKEVIYTINLQLVNNPTSPANKIYISIFEGGLSFMWIPSMPEA